MKTDRHARIAAARYRGARTADSELIVPTPASIQPAADVGAGNSASPSMNATEHASGAKLNSPRNDITNATVVAIAEH